MELSKEEPVAKVDVVVPPRPAPPANVRLRQALHVDFLMASDVGGLFVVGWVDDSLSALTDLRIEIGGWSSTLKPQTMARIRRRDVEAALGSGRAHTYGFWAVVFSEGALESDVTCRVSANLRNGAMYTSVVNLRCCTEAQLRATVLNYMSENQPGFGSTPGSQEDLNRLLHEQRNRFIPLSGAKASAAAAVPRHHLEMVAISEGGGLMVTGWIDDRTTPLDCVRVIGPTWKVCFDGETLARACRDDVQRELLASHRHPFAFWSFAATGQPLPSGGAITVEVQTKAGTCSQSTVQVRRMPDVELRNVVLGELAAAQFQGNRTAEAMACLEGFIGRQILQFNLKVGRAAIAGPYVEHLRPNRSGRTPKGSIVVCLYGKPEFLFLQASMFSGRPGIEDYEFVYVCNSPELAERLLNEAQITRDTYGLDTTLVLLAGNAGFGAANNLGVSHCRSDRILITNPDVFPRDPAWAARHLEIVDGLPADQTRIFGAPLYYDDGSLMHGGMYFETDTVLSARPGGFEPKRTVRVEHYGKGAPPGAKNFVRPRPVPAVTGAFISCARPWFEQLGGFTEDYVFGHYEDADLCLKSLVKGKPAWLHDLRLWHLEGKGSTRLPVHEGGSLVNRWLFSERWGELVSTTLAGPDPSHALLHTTRPALAPPANGAVNGSGSAAALQQVHVTAAPPSVPAAPRRVPLAAANGATSGPTSGPTSGAAIAGVARRSRSTAVAQRES